MKRVHGDIEKAARSRTGTAHDRAQRIGKLRAGAVAQAADEARLSASEGILIEAGGITHRLEWARAELVDGAETAVRLRPLGGSDDGSADIVVINPPILVADPQGDVEIDGRRYREDPLAALGQVLSRHVGGRQ